MFRRIQDWSRRHVGELIIAGASRERDLTSKLRFPPSGPRGRLDIVETSPLRWFRRHLGDTMIATGVIHLAASPLFYRDALADLVREGLVGTLTDMTRYQHLEAYWYVASGSLMIGIGLLTRAQRRATGTLPPAFGWLMLLSMTFLSLIMPVTGMWAVAVQGGIAILLAQDVSEGIPDAVDL